MYKSIFTLLLSFVTLHLCAQEKLFKIDYKLSLSEALLSEADSSTESSLAMIAALAAAFAEDDKPQVQAWVNKDFIRVQTEGLGENIQITNRKTGESYILYPSMQTYTEASDATDKLDIQATEDDFNVFSTADLDLQFIEGRSKTIAGIPCKLAILDLGNPEYEDIIPEGAQLEIWYTETLPSLYWGEYAYLKKLPGAALYIGAYGMGIEASSVNTVAFDASLFEVPEEYELQDYSSADYDASDIPLGHDLFTYQDEETSLIGIKDADNNIITPAKYSGIYEFVEDYAVVLSADGLYGLINAETEEVIPCTWDYLQLDGEQPYLIFSENSKMGIMTPQQEVIVPAEYEYLSSFNQGYATFTEGTKSGLINLKGEVVLPATYEVISEYVQDKAIILEGDLYYLVDIKSNKKSTTGYTYLAFANEDNLLVASKNEKYGYISYAEKEVIPFKYYYATPFYDGIATVYETEDGDIQYINGKGETVDVATEW